MKTSISIILLLLLTFSCSKSTNDAEFIHQVSGRYLFNPDEIIEVYFEEDNLLLNWSGATGIKPMKIDNNTFYVKEMNEKIQFLSNPTDNEMYICLVPKEKVTDISYNYKKVDGNYRTPTEYIEAKEYDKAKEAYLLIQNDDSLSPIVRERNFNQWGYSKLRTKDNQEAVEIFSINVALYPNSANVYDSLAEALLATGDTIGAIENYNKTLSMDSGNRNAKRQLKKIEKKK